MKRKFLKTRCVICRKIIPIPPDVLEMLFNETDARGFAVCPNCGKFALTFKIGKN